jgi:hypothetical protein
LLLALVTQAVQVVVQLELTELPELLRKDTEVEILIKFLEQAVVVQQLLELTELVRLLVQTVALV